MTHRLIRFIASPLFPMPRTHIKPLIKPSRLMMPPKLTVTVPRFSAPFLRAPRN